MKKLVIVSILSSLFGLGALEVQFDYTTLDVPANWAKKTGEWGQISYVSPKGTSLEITNFGYDMPQYEEVLDYKEGLDKSKIQKKKTKKGLDYLYYEGQDQVSKSPVIWAVFNGYRYRGLREEPADVGNGLFFSGTSLAADKPAIDAIIQSLKTQPRLDKKLSRHTFPSGGLSFEVPSDWIKAPFIGNFSNSDQYINPNGAYMHTDLLREIKESDLDGMFKNGYSGYKGSQLGNPTNYQNKNGVKAKVYYGGTLIPTNDNHQADFAIIAIPFKTNEVAVFVIVSSLGDPARIKQILESLKKE